MINALLALAIRAFLNVALLRAALGLVTPKNPNNTWGNAIWAALVINVIAVPLLWVWWLLIPLLLYWFIWFFTLTSVFKIRKLQALAVGIVAAFLAWLVALVLPVS